LEDVCSHIAIIQDGSLLAAGHTDEITNQLTSGRRVLARFADGTSEEFEIVDEREQGELLQRLATEPDRTLVEFARIGGGLEELFLAITKGIDE
jgi:ABC-type multidrug transport system ATPase subunit